MYNKDNVNDLDVFTKMANRHADQVHDEEELRSFFEGKNPPQYEILADGTKINLATGKEVRTFIEYDEYGNPIGSIDYEYENGLTVAPETGMEPYRKKAYLKSSSGMDKSLKDKLKTAAKVIAVTVVLAASLQGCINYIEDNNAKTDDLFTKYHEYEDYAKENGIPINADTYATWVNSQTNSNSRKQG